MGVTGPYDVDLYQATEKVGTYATPTAPVQVFLVVLQRWRRTTQQRAGQSPLNAVKQTRLHQKQTKFVHTLYANIVGLHAF